MTTTRRKQMANELVRLIRGAALTRPQLDDFEKTYLTAEGMKIVRAMTPTMDVIYLYRRAHQALEAGY